MDVQPCLERIPRCLSDGTDLLALDLTNAKNRRVHECGRGVSSVLLSRIFFFRGKAVHNGQLVSVSSSLNPVQCNPMLNAMHIGDCYRDFPLRPAYCRNPWVSRSRQVEYRQANLGVAAVEICLTAVSQSVSRSHIPMRSDRK